MKVLIVAVTHVRGLAEKPDEPTHELPLTYISRIFFRDMGGFQKNLFRRKFDDI